MKREARREQREGRAGPVRALGVILLALVGFAGAPNALAAQDTRADSAATLLRAARVLEARGELRLARELFRVLAERFPEAMDAAAAREAVRRLGDDDTLIGLGRAGFIAYHTAFGAWLGVIIPAALDVEAEAPYGAGLLIGAPLGFFGSRALASSRELTRGQAAIMQFASTWGTWQGLGWQAAADVGDDEICEFDACYGSSSSTAPWGMALAGGLAGLGVGLLASRLEITEGQAALVSNTGYWATWYGYLAAYLTDSSDDTAVATALVVGNAGVLLAIPAARAWRPTATRVRTISAAGLAGALVGAGAALLLSAEGDQEVATLFAAGTTVGLLAGVALTGNRSSARPDDNPAGGDALLSYRGGWRLNAPLPRPAAVAAPEGSRRLTVPGVRVGLFTMNW